MPVDHGMSDSTLYGIWRAMKQRCLNPRHENYAYYGGRGVRVCDAWMTFRPFMEWAMANGYVDGLEIDREDTDGNYEPGNCRWSTRSEQMQNVRKHRDARSSRFKGVYQMRRRRKWRAVICQNRRRFDLGCFGSEMDAAKAYDQKARELFGQKAKTNFLTTT